MPCHSRYDANSGPRVPDVLKLVETNKDLRVVLKEFPILGPGSAYAARAALASRKQGKYWDFHLALLEPDPAARSRGRDPVACGVAGSTVAECPGDRFRIDPDQQSQRRLVR